MKRKHDVVTRTVVYSFDGLDSITFHADKASSANRAYAELFGFGSRIQDTAALSREVKGADGKKVVQTITEQMRRDEVQRLVDHYESGTSEWNMGRSPTQNPLILAMATSAGVDYATMAAKIGSDELAEFAKMAMAK